MPSQSDFVLPAPELSPGFEWVQDYDELLEQIAESNVVDADWSILKEMIKYKIAENVKGYLALGPPWPLLPEDALQARVDAYDALDSFKAPPFTIQRLCELSLAPRAHYTSLPKWLRALSRTLSVSSTRDAFTETEPNEPLPRPPTYNPASSTSSASGSSVGMEGLTANGATIRPPTQDREETPFASGSGPNTPLLSPIPWLTVGSEGAVYHVNDTDPADLRKYGPQGSPDNIDEEEERRVNADSPTTQRVKQSLSGSPPTAAHEPLSAQATASDSPTKPHAQNTPTGGLVDEVDPGSGTSEVAEPVSLTHAASTSVASGSGNAMVVDGLRMADSLSSRFERASSPRVERGSPQKEDN